MIIPKILFAAAVLLSLASADDRPNILFIMSDDHTTQAIGVYGGRLAGLDPTPHLDALAREGVILENAFCHNSICTPSRACIMTGQYSHVNGVTGLNHPLKSGRHHLSREMQKAGYETAVIGKWHLKTLPEHFDFYKVLVGQGSYFDPQFKVPGKTEMVRMEGHSSDCITDAAIEWLRGRDTARPFFLKLHYKAPHGPFKPAPRYATYLEDVVIPEPKSLFERGNHGSIGVNGHNDELRSLIGTSISGRHFKGGYARRFGGDSEDPVQRTKHAYQHYLKQYLRCVKGVDDNLKRVFEFLRSEGLYDTTVIMYTGDQGMFLGEHDYIDKRWGYEESMRMPFVVRYPKAIPAGTRTDAIVENVDYGPTMLDYAGVKTPDYMQGKSFRAILETGEEPEGWRRSAYYHYWFHMMHHYNPAHLGLRTKRYKLIMYYGARGSVEPETPPAWELYDLEKDPGEMNNVYDALEYAGAVKELKDELRARRKDSGDDNPEIEVNRIIDDFWEYDEEDRKRAIEISHQRLARGIQAKSRDKKKP